MKGFLRCETRCKNNVLDFMWITFDTFTNLPEQRDFPNTQTLLKSDWDQAKTAWLKVHIHTSPVFAKHGLRLALKCLELSQTNTGHLDLPHLKPFFYFLINFRDSRLGSVNHSAFCVQWISQTRTDFRLLPAAQATFASLQNCKPLIEVHPHKATPPTASL